MFAPPSPMRAGSAEERPYAHGIRHVRHLEVAGDQRPVAEESADDALVELDGRDAGEANGRGAAASHAVDDEELVGRQDEARPVPAPDGRERQHGRGEQHRGSESSERPGDGEPGEDERHPHPGQDERPRQRSRERRTVRPGLEPDLLAGFEGAHAAALRRRGPASSFRAPTDARQSRQMRDTARRSFLAAIIVVAVVVAAFALWKLRILIALLFLAFTISAAMRPGVEALYRRRVPRGVGIAIHYLGLVAAIGLLLYFVIPSAVDQIQEAVPTSSSELEREASESSGVRERLLRSVQNRLDELPSGSELVDPAVTVTVTAFEVAIGIVFTLACAAYWIFERERAEHLVLSLVPRTRRRLVRDTWELIDRKLGAYVRGQLLLVVLVATVLSVAFWVVGLPFWLLIGTFAGVVELIPVIGPLAAGALAVGVGFTVSWQTALAAGVVVWIVRLVEDYTVIPRVLGHAVGLTPLTVLVSVSAVAILFGGFAVLLAIPFAAVVATLVDVIVRDRNPAEEDVPKVIFPAKESETSGIG